MRSFLLLAAAGFYGGLASAIPLEASALPSTTSLQASPTSNATAPCAQVSEAYHKAPVFGSGLVTVPAAMAYACIKSVPFNASSATLLIKHIRPYLGWQSTIDMLKNPPQEYQQKVQPAVDIMGGLDKIAKRIAAGGYTAEFDFGMDLYLLILSAHDGHLTYVPDIVGNIFTWGRQVPLVSVSEDGEKKKRRRRRDGAGGKKKASLGRGRALTCCELPT